MSADRQTLSFYEGNAADYAEKTTPPKGTTRDLRAFAEALDPGAKVLDFGCGGGWASRWLAAQGFAVTALDPTPAMVENLANCAGIETIQGDISDLPAGARFGGIWAHFSLQHIPREALPVALRRLARALTPGGLIAIGIHEGDESMRDGLGRLYNHWTAPSLGAILAAENVSITAERRHPDKGFDGRDFTALHLIARRVR